MPKNKSKKKLISAPPPLISPLEYFRQAQLWAAFSAALHKKTEEGFREALDLGPALKRAGGGLWLVESDHCHALMNWARGAVVERTSTQEWVSTWSSESMRESMTHALWELLVLGGARSERWINALSTDLLRGERQVGPIHFACGFGSFTALELLLDCPETNVNLTTADGFTTPFMHCIRFHTLGQNCARLLVEKRWYDLDIDAQYANGQTIAQKLLAAPYHEICPEIRAAWTGLLSYLKTIYYPNICEMLRSILPTLDLVQMIFSYCKPNSL